MYSFLIHVLRAGIVVALVISLFGQIVIIPTSLGNSADTYPGLSGLVVPYAIIAILGVACAQCVLVALWALLGLARKRRFFGRRAFGWVTAIIGAGAAATLLAFGSAVHLFLMGVPQSVPTMVMVGWLAAAVVASLCGAGFTILVVVLRRQLRKASKLRPDLAAAG